MSQVTELLRDWSAGRQEARDELLRLVYDPVRGADTVDLAQPASPIPG